MAILWIPLVLFWTRSSLPLFAEFIEEYVGKGVGLKLISQIYRYFIPLTGISLAFIICHLIERYFNKIGKMLGYLGAMTMEIYILQSFCFNIFSTPVQLFNVFINIILGILIPSTISLWFRNGKITKILFGR